MPDKDLLQLLLDYQEWQNFDCKRAAAEPHRFLEAAIAFANSNGGTLVIGMEDPEKSEGEKRLIGISENPQNVSEFLKLMDKEIDPPILGWQHFEEVFTSKNQTDALLVVCIPKSNDIHSLKRGDTYVRRGYQNVKIGAAEIIRLKYEKGAIKYEDEPSGIVSFDDINLDLLHQYKTNNGSANENDWQFLKDNGLAVKRNEVLEMTRAGVLLFGRNPSVTLRSKCSIKISHYYGKSPSYSGRPNFVRAPLTIEGSLFMQIEQAMQYFREVAKTARPKLEGSGFRSTFIVPEWAFQEAVTNAVVHRNYYTQNDIQIRFFDDRVEIESPGTYPGHITTQNIRQERFARNPLIVRSLNRFPSPPNLDIGEGVDRIFSVMREHNLYDPQYSPPSAHPNTVLLVLLNLQKVEFWDTVSNYLDQHFRITNHTAREITGIRDTLKMSRLLRAWCERDLLEKIGTAKKNCFYKKPGAVMPSLFSGGSEKKL